MSTLKPKTRIKKELEAALPPNAVGSSTENDVEICKQTETEFETAKVEPENQTGKETKARVDASASRQGAYTTVETGICL